MIEVLVALIRYAWFRLSGGEELSGHYVIYDEMDSYLKGYNDEEERRKRREKHPPARLTQDNTAGYNEGVNDAEGQG